MICLSFLFLFFSFFEFSDVAATRSFFQTNFGRFLLQNNKENIGVFILLLLFLRDSVNSTNSE
jgi:hypothetical protein